MELAGDTGILETLLTVTFNDPVTPMGDAFDMYTLPVTDKGDALATVTAKAELLMATLPVTESGDALATVTASAELLMATLPVTLNGLDVSKVVDPLTIMGDTLAIVTASAELLMYTLPVTLNGLDVSKVVDPLTIMGDTLATVTYMAPPVTHRPLTNSPPSTIMLPFTSKSSMTILWACPKFTANSRINDISLLIILYFF
jgi:hypothetical protein